MPMPPFLRKDRSPGVSTPITRTPDVIPGQESDQDQGLNAAASSIINAIEAKDANSLAKALQDTFEILQNQPEGEAEPMEEEQDNG